MFVYIIVYNFHFNYHTKFIFNTLPPPKQSSEINHSSYIKTINTYHGYYENVFILSCSDIKLPPEAFMSERTEWSKSRVPYKCLKFLKKYKKAFKNIKPYALQMDRPLNLAPLSFTPACTISQDMIDPLLITWHS